jgi:CheY-like chemotaxis protein
MTRGPLFRAAIIEDNAQNYDTALRVIRDILQGDVVHASTRGSLFLKWFEGWHQLNPHSKIDIILLDIALPLMNGFEVLKEIRKVEALRTTKIIAYTANVLQDAVLKYQVAGFDSYIGKPISITNFGKQIQSVLSDQVVW